MSFTSHTVISEPNPSNSGTELSKANTSNTERTNHNTCLNHCFWRSFPCCDLNGIWIYYQRSHTFITHMHPKSYPICVFLCIQALRDQQLQQYSVNIKSAVQCQQNEDDLQLKHPPAYNTQHFNLFQISCHAHWHRGKRPFSPKKNTAQQAVYCWLKMHFHIGPLMYFLLSKFQGSNLHNFSHHGLMKNATILVMGADARF